MNAKMMILPVCAALAGAAQAASGDKPNVILILADDMGYGDIAALNPECRIPTPNLDRLRAEGMLFTDAHSGSALSTPTRYGIVTGQYCFRSELKSGVLNGYSPLLIPPQVMTVGGLLSSAGYSTAVIGKWHLGLGWGKKDETKPLTRGKGFNQKDDNVDFSAPLTAGPHTCGFDYSYILPASLDIAPYVYVENGSVENKEMVRMAGYGNLDAVGEERGVFWREGMASADFKIENTLDHFADKALGYIAASRADRPFFLYFPMTAPHTPWLPAQQYRGRSGAGRYGDFVCHLDDIAGRILALLERKGIADNTIVMFASDNGAFWDKRDQQAYPAHSANYIFRGLKADAWDGGHHIPLLVRWPGVVKQGDTNAQLVCLTDLMATVADVAGVEVPSGQGEDSRSFYPALQGKKHYEGIRQSVIHHSGPGMFVMRDGKWKFIDGQGSGGRSEDAQDVPDAPGQLYDMRRDVGEERNLYFEKPKKVEALKKELEEIKISGF